MKIIKVIIIDDERPARDEVKRLLADYPEFDIIAEAKNADEAKVLIELKQPDLIFLDIQMPEKSGFELLELLQHVPTVIFTTAYDQYAIKAFEVSALDYLMKPIREERFAKAIEQVKKSIPLIADKQIFVKDRRQYHFISWSKIHLIESMDNYARLFFDDKNVFLKSSLNQLEKQLDQSIFFRINRSQIINRQFIQKINSAANGRLKITLKSGQVYEASERQSVKFKNMGQG